MLSSTGSVMVAMALTFLLTTRAFMLDHVNNSTRGLSLVVTSELAYAMPCVNLYVACHAVALHFLSFVQCCVHCCGLQRCHVSLSIQLLSLPDRIVSSKSSFLDHRHMFVMVSLSLVCLPTFLL